MKAMVRLAPEITIKSNAVRSKFVKTLKKNIRSAFKSFEVEAKVTSSWARIFVESESTAIIDILKNIFGISSISPLEWISSSDLKTLKSVSVEKFSHLLSGKSFCVRVKRSGARGFTSIEAEKEIGSALYSYGEKVDLKNPEFQLEIEANETEAYYFCRRIKGPGGLPIGVEGKVLSLMSGGFDSPIASWMMMKRGLACDYVFLNLASNEYQKATLQVTKNLVNRWSHGYKPKFYSINFQEVIKKIQSECDPKMAQIVLKRLMLKSASHLGKAGLCEYDALVTGEAIGQVSSQTLSNLIAIDKATDDLVLRPLVGADKQEIINISRNIGTHSLCEKIKEYCSITPKYPKTKCSQERAKIEDEKVPSETYLKEVENCEIIDIYSYQEQNSSEITVENFHDAEVIFDVREKEHYDYWHFPKAKHIPLDRWEEPLKTLNKSTNIVFYCSFGTESALIAEKAQSKGYSSCFSYKFPSTHLYKILKPSSKESTDNQKLDYFFKE